MHSEDLLTGLGLGSESEVNFIKMQAISVYCILRNVMRYTDKNSFLFFSENFKESIKNHGSYSQMANTIKTVPHT